MNRKKHLKYTTLYKFHLVGSVSVHIFVRDLPVFWNQTPLGAAMSEICTFLTSADPEFFIPKAHTWVHTEWSELSHVLQPLRNWKDIVFVEVVVRISTHLNSDLHVQTFYIVPLWKCLTFFITKVNHYNWLYVCSFKLYCFEGLLSCGLQIL